MSAKIKTYHFFPFSSSSSLVMMSETHILSIHSFDFAFTSGENP